MQIEAQIVANVVSVLLKVIPNALHWARERKNRMDADTRKRMEDVYGQGYPWADHGLGWELYKYSKALEAEVIRLGGTVPLERGGAK